MQTRCKTMRRGQQSVSWSPFQSLRFCRPVNQLQVADDDGDRKGSSSKTTSASFGCHCRLQIQLYTATYLQIDRETRWTRF